MTLNITLELFQCEPPVRSLRDTVVVRAPGQPGEPQGEAHFYDSSEVIDSLNNPPDLIRETHGLPIATPTRHPQTKQTVDVYVDSTPPPVNPAAMPSPLPIRDGVITIELDRGGAVSTQKKDQPHKPPPPLKNSHAGSEGIDVGIAGQPGHLKE